VGCGQRWKPIGVNSWTLIHTFGVRGAFLWVSIRFSPRNLKLQQPQLPRSGPNGQPPESSHLERGNGRLAITMTDMKAFRLGENIATTPGRIVYQNELMQLIQYTPSTREVRRRLIVPPWINKFYVLDLQPKNSFIKWAVDQGHTVFAISWVNPDEKLAEKGFEDYMLEGPLAALDAIESATGERSVNAIGYCLGGTLLASMLAYSAAKGDDRITSATYFATLVDFTEVGDMAVFIDEEQLASFERRMRERGYLEAQDMATTFNMFAPMT
jgi:polyhydroxyalkanoate synthase